MLSKGKLIWTYKVSVVIILNENMYVTTAKTVGHERYRVLCEVSTVM